MNQKLKGYEVFKIIALLMISSIISACGGDDSNINNTQQVVTNSPVVQTPPQWPLNSIEGLEFNLIGEKVVNLMVGESYSEQGTQAIGNPEGDVSSSVVSFGSVNSNRKGDYLLRYQIGDNSGGIAELIRIVRVFDDEPVLQSQRRESITGANLGYLEHLPMDYAGDEDSKSPLIIFNHGSGASGTGNLSDVECCGLAGVLDSRDWDNTLPFVILSPQRVEGRDTPTMDEFVEYALATYEVDPDRVYMAGWSEGALATLLYAVEHPEKLAAIVPTAGGFFFGVPSDVCDASSVPMWVFLGNRDSNTINNSGVNTVNAYNGCNPTETARLTRYLDAGHFDTSIWPFLPDENFEIETSSDPIDQSIFEWLLSHSL